MELNASLLKPKIAYISDQHYPIEKADSEQVVNTVSALAAEGAHVDLVIPRDWTTFGSDKSERIARLKDFYFLRNGFTTAELVHLPLSNLRLEKYSHGILAPVWARLSGYDIIYSRNLLPVFIAFALNLKIIFETYRLHKLFVVKVLKHLTRLSNFLGIITHSEPSKERLLMNGVPAEKVTVIPNGFNPELFASDLTQEEARKIAGFEPNEKIACYSGRLDREKGIEALIDLAGQTPEVQYYFIGKTQKDAPNWILEQCKTKQIHNVTVLGWMNPNKLTTYLFAADVLLIPPVSAPLHKHGKTVLPMKLFQYLASARPILAPRLPDIHTLLTEENAVLVEPDDPAAAVAAIHRIFEQPDWASEIARKARHSAQEYTWENRARRILQFIHERL